MSRNDYNYPVRVNGLSVEVYNDFDKAMRIFNKKVQESGLLRELRERTYFEKNSETRVRKQKIARKRWLKKIERDKHIEDMQISKRRR